MSHWFTQDQLASAHRDDLDREADRSALGRMVAPRRSRGPIGRIMLALGAIHRRWLEAELRSARRQVEALERALGYVRAD